MALGYMQRETNNLQTSCEDWYREDAEVMYVQKRGNIIWLKQTVPGAGGSNRKCAVTDRASAVSEA